MHAVSADVLSRWRSGAKQMAPVEAAHMNKCQPAMDARERSRAPSFAEIFRTLRATCHDGSDADLSWLRL
eukprot:3912813-Pyramimonas_sp.AAC.1